MNFFKANSSKKELKELLSHAQHVRRMHEDIASEEQIAEILAAEKATRCARSSGDLKQMKIAANALEKVCLKMNPPRNHPKLRENIEVLFVSIAAAMAIRAYGFQPFKIPTGSMQPTLYGITTQEKPTLPGKDPVSRLANLVLFGEKPQTVRAKTSGYFRMKQSLNGLQEIDLQTSKAPASHVLYINNTPHRISDNMLLENRDRLISLIGKRINKGDVLASINGVIKSGDYILVNRLKYNFIRPKRGDITVFDTCDLTHPQVRNNAYYIKRMVGLPGETISVAPPYLLVNGKKPTEARFDKIFNHENYDGYTLGDARSIPIIEKLGDSISLADDQYLFFGDNTTLSLDGRYFGAVNRKRILGPAFFVCWPLDRAGFAEKDH